MKFRKVFLIFSIFCLGAFLTGCGCSKNKKESNKSSTSASSGVESSTNSENDAKATTKLGTLVTSNKVKDQFKKPEKGEEVAVITVKNFGKIKCRLFPEVAPNSIKNFKQFAKEGRYNGGSFHRVIKDFMIQTGKEADEKGEMIKSAVELNQSVRHYNGALCMARNQSKTQGQGCQFYIVSSNQGTEKGKKVDFDAIKNTTDGSYKAENLNIEVEFDDDVKKLYKEHGGRPDLDMLYTVIGQVYEGQDVVDKIAAVEIKEPTEEDKQKGTENVPKDPVVVEKVEIVKV